MINESIDNIGLSVRAYNVLTNAGVKNIRDMALLAKDLQNFKNCGKKTYYEIIDKIKELKDEGFYDQDFIDSCLNGVSDNGNFIDTLSLSVRSKNVLKSLNIISKEQLAELTYEQLKNVRNSGTKTIDEILNYIENYKSTYLYSESTNYKFPIKHIFNLCGNTAIENIVKSNLCEVYRFNNINTIYDLIKHQGNIFAENEKGWEEFNYLKKYFTDLAYNPLTINTNNRLLELYVNIPFELVNKYRLFDLVKIKSILNYCLDNFKCLSLKEQIDLKLFLNWINCFIIEDEKQYFIDKLELTDKQKEILIYRNIHTLEETGVLYNVTRERIRQIEAKACLKIEKNLSNIPFKKPMDNSFYDYNLCDNEEKLLLYIDSISTHFFEKIKDNNRYIYLNLELVNVLNNIIMNNTLELDEQGYIDYTNENEEKYFELSLNYLGLKYHNKHLFYEIPKVKMVKYAMNKIGRGIKITDSNDRKLVIDTVFELFGEQLEDSRGLDALISNSGVRVDSGTYSATDNIIPLEKETFEKIIEYVKKNRIINSRDLFVPFGDVLIKHNISNENILYRYLKECLNDILYFNGVSGVISSNPNDSSWGVVISKFIQEQERPVSKAEIMGKFPITSPVYDSLAVNFDDIIKWGRSELFLKSLVFFKEEDKQKFFSIISEVRIMKFDEVLKLFNSINKDIIVKNQITNSYSLCSLLDTVFGEQIIIHKDKEIITVPDTKKEVKKEQYTIADELTI